MALRVNHFLLLFFLVLILFYLSELAYTMLKYIFCFLRINLVVNFWAIIFSCAAMVQGFMDDTTTKPVHTLQEARVLKVCIRCKGPTS